MSISRGMDKEDVVHIYKGILLSHKKEWNCAICRGMDGLRDCDTEWNKLERENDKYHMISLICGILKKNDTNELIYKTETDSQTSKTNLWLTNGKHGGRDKLGVWD